MVSRSEFKTLVEAGLAEIPEKFLRRLKNVGIVIEEEPTEQQRRKLRLRRDHTLFGLYEGIPQTRRGNHYYWVLPDKITIFRKPILEYARSPGEIRKLVRDTVWHEIAHHFGLDEAAVRTKERRRRSA